MGTIAPSAARLEQAAYESETVARHAPIAHRRVRRVFAWAAIVLVFALVLELTCRIEDWIMYRMPIISRYASLNDLVIRDADGMHGRPNARFEKWVINSLGTRGPEATALPAAGTIRVFTVGASETFGLRESPEREFPRQLEDSLNARVARGECHEQSDGPRLRFEVLNAAFAGMGLPTIDQDIRNRLRRFRPDLIFTYPSPAQYLEEEIPFAALPDSSERATPPSLLRGLRPRSAARIREQLKLLLPEWIKMGIRSSQKRKALRSHPPHWQFIEIPADRVARYDADLRRLIGTIRRVGAEPVVASHANLFMGRATRDPYELVAWEKFYPRATGATIIAFDSVAREVTNRVAKDSGVVSVDAARRLAAAPASAFADFVHFTDLGSSHMADVASAGIIQAAQRSGRCRVESSSPAHETEAGTSPLERR
jgi:hypothetical protein